MEAKNTAFAILCGGQSRRMGRDKAFIRLGEESLLRRLAKVGKGFGERLVSTDHRLMAKETGFRMVPDIQKDCGPVGAIYSVLAAMKSEAVLTLPCDMPFFPAALAREMLSAMPDTAKALMLTGRSGRAYPLCAVFRKSCLPTVKEHVETGKLKAVPMMEVLGAVHMTLPEKFSEKVLMNLNTPEDLEAVQSVLRERG
ncbi:MAG TPA: molybdenum cofactor guanylyltransferase [Clostridiales bacterium]|jgi:molybdopterin-guanine dinucleotide biosynthesis protein B|nr:molybdenum cofactor guanylyltransferase [Clostridiales bacterium]